MCLNGGGVGKGEIGDVYVIYIGSLKGHILKFLRALLVVIKKKIIPKLVKTSPINSWFNPSFIVYQIISAEMKTCMNDPNCLRIMDLNQQLKFSIFTNCNGKGNFEWTNTSIYIFLKMVLNSSQPIPLIMFKR